MSLKKNADSNLVRRTLPRLQIGAAWMLLGLFSFAGCSTMPNPAKRLVNHLGTKTSEAMMRNKIEKDKFPTAKEAGLD